ncbi:MAG: tRNA-uridine aminocarboxypropyltransferase [Sulfurimonadaceae bacterium]|nr:tRNA-uridine aminocarboxypropyltransferase [Sulfurimonadaceae bacterium]
MTFYGDRAKCYKCYRPQSSCMCGHIHPFTTKTKFVILMHPKEFKKVKNNTGFLTHLTLSNSEIFIGVDFSAHKRINDIIATHQSYILYPSSCALNLSHERPVKEDTTKNLAIFIIDSTWACTRKIFTQSTNLSTLRHMSFTTQKTSQYQIKEQPKSNYLSTIESTLVVLEELSKWEIERVEEKNMQNFLNPFFEMIAYQQKIIAHSQSQTARFRVKK